MAPLTRRRCDNNNVPVSIMAEYYAQRAGAGLIIAEGTSPSPNGTGYANMPGLYNQKQLEGWEKIVKAVHHKKGKIFLQVMHTGRVGHPNNLGKNAKFIAPSAIAHDGEVATYDLCKKKCPTPKEMTLADVKDTINEFANCASLAKYGSLD